MPKRKARLLKPYYLLTREGKRLRRKETDEEFKDSLSSTDEYNTIEDNNSNPQPGPSHELNISSVPQQNAFNQTEASNSLSDDFISEEESSFSTYSIVSSDLDDDEEVFSDSSSDLGSEHDVPKQNDNLLPIKNFLRSWSKENNITISSLSSLSVGLKTLHPECFSNLPSDGRTILKTPVNISIEEMSPGQYFHIGLKRQLGQIFSKESNKPKDIGLLFNIDGLPVFRSSTKEFYPILFSIPTVVDLRNKVFAVGIYCGDQKPDDLSLFLGRLVNEIKDVTENGIYVKGKMINVSILGFCCDTPAKSYIMGITSHTGFLSCTRCKVHGVTIENRRVFLECECEPRTHDDFKNRVDRVYQPRTTPLVNVPSIKFPNSFALDYMHVVCLGVMRFLLITWTSGSLPLRLSKTQREIVSDQLVSLKTCIPDELARKPRDLKQLKYWKATEYRMFLLYLGPMILKNVLDFNKYYHFISLHVAITLLLSQEKCSDDSQVAYAKKLLISFFNNFKILYGEMYTSHNVHSLIHLADDVFYFKDKIPNFTIHSISAFQFENFLQAIKKKVRGKSKPLQQIGKRLEESMILNEETSKDNKESCKYPVLKFVHNDGPLPALCWGLQYKKIEYGCFMLSNSPPNNCAILTDNSIIIVENFVLTKDAGKIVVGKQFLCTNDLYNQPVYPSSKLNIKKVDKLGPRKFWPAETVKGKCILLEINRKHVAFPMIHCF